MICNAVTCLKYSLFTFLAVIFGTIFLHVLGYAVFSGYYVNRYYSDDLVRWRESSLSRIPDQ